ncbi:MAG: 2-C-methyl-D-erythritol 2,4-cyclodiphosphate synthase [Tannerella sp.]|nr:2-C-methyl-D-erythritol 2,4-cyclodiphosphate synthase [Tannerella sp.]
MKIRTGFGYDVHAFAKGRDLCLGGIRIEYPEGLCGHSDADVLIHAICDALLGAANLRDIGFHFPDTSGDTKDMDSKILLHKTMNLIRNAGYELGNADATIVAEQPKLSQHIPAMQETLAKVMQVDKNDISIKATTSEKLGFTGRKEGIAAYAAVLIQETGK